MEQERIICAAISIKNASGEEVIIGGIRHHNCFDTARKLGNNVYINQDKQGFLTSANRFVDRKEAMWIAKQADQLIRETNLEYLFSEDIY